MQGQQEKATSGPEALARLCSGKLAETVRAERLRWDTASAGEAS